MLVGDLDTYLATPSILMLPNHTLKVAPKLEAKRSNNKSLTTRRGAGREQYVD
jgi:hypothetical protein